MWGRVRHIVRKEVYQTFREPRMRFVLFLPPLIQLLLFGYAVNMDVERARIGWIDRDRTPESRALLAEFEGTRHLRVTQTPRGEEQAQRLLDGGEVEAVVQILPGFGSRLHRGEKVDIQILLDGTNSNIASIVSNYVNQIVRRYSRRIEARRQAVVGHETTRPALETRTRIWFNADLRSQNYFVPGVVVNIIALVTVMLTAMAIVREKEIGTLEQLLVTPIRPLELILGKTLPFAAVGLLELAFVTSAALLIFEIPFRGNPLVLLCGAVLFLLTTLSVGLLISTVSGTQQQAMLGSFLFFLPAFMLSGFAFPIRNMPLVVQYLTLLDPLRYFVEIVRGVFLKGSGMLVLWPQMAALLLLGLAVVSLSVHRFGRRPE